MLSPLAAIAGAPVEAQWDIPPWVDPGESFKGKVTLSESPDSDVSVHYEYVDARTGKVTAEPVEDKAGVFAFEIPASGYADSDTLKLWLETRQGAQSAVQSVPLSQAFEFDITGDAALLTTVDIELEHTVADTPVALLTGIFDDIWSGLFVKRAADVLGKRVYNGGPLCEHNKAPRSTFDDLANEVAGLELNEHVWEVIDEAGSDADSFEAVFASMACTLNRCGPCSCLTFGCGVQVRPPSSLVATSAT